MVPPSSATWLVLFIQLIIQSKPSKARAKKMTQNGWPTGWCTVSSVWASSSLIFSSTGSHFTTLLSVSSYCGAWPQCPGMAHRLSTTKWFGLPSFAMRPQWTTWSATSVGRPWVLPRTSPEKSWPLWWRTKLWSHHRHLLLSLKLKVYQVHQEKHPQLKLVHQRWTKKEDSLDSSRGRGGALVRKKRREKGFFLIILTDFNRIVTSVKETDFLFF